MNLQMIETFEPFVTFWTFVFSILTMSEFMFCQSTLISKDLKKRLSHHLVRTALERITLLQSGCAQKCPLDVELLLAR